MNIDRSSAVQARPRTSALAGLLVVAIAFTGGPGRTSIAEASEEGEWSIVASPNTSVSNPTNFLTSVACVGSTDCWAVGHSYVRGVPQTLIERWDGESWSIVPSPNTIITRSNVLSDVSCVSVSECWAVGYHHNGAVQQTLIERWDGESWSIVPSPNTSVSRTNVLAGVHCTASSHCWAVGRHHEGSDSQTLIERLDGESWSIVPSPNTSATSNNSLSAITCVSASDCWAVGGSGGSDSQTNVYPIYQTLIERWDGTSWSIVPSPNTIPLQSNFLFDVTCPSASECWTVGYAYSDTPAGSPVQQTLVARFSGSSWSIVSSPNTSAVRHNVLSGVTCASTTDCWAVGFAKAGGFGVGGVQTSSIVEQTLVQHWDGTSWSIVSSPNSDPAQTNILYGVTCRARSDCTAVGYADRGGSQTLVQRWEGTAWSISASPNVEAFHAANHLHATTCVGANLCFAVGYYHNGGVYQTLIQRWNGTAWSILSSPNTAGNHDNVLSGVACTSATNCWAVGYSDAGGLRRTLIQRWNGSSWSIVPSPNTGTDRDTFLSGVTCTSTTDCWAVGSSGESDTGGVVFQTMAIRWDGTVWSLVPSANTSPVNGNVLYRVSCVDAADCWGVGYSYTGSIRQTLVEHWDGAEWAIVSSPNASATNLLTDVTCVSASDCWAVGHSNPMGTNQTLVEHWDGDAWSIVASPNASSGSSYLFGVTCMAASECWAVGYAFDGATHTLVERWDGTAWTLSPSPNASPTLNNLLLGVTCSAPPDCWAVGYHHNGTRYQTLVLRHSP